MYERGSDKILYLPAISLGVLSYHDFNELSFSLLSGLALSNLESAILYVISATVVLIFLEDVKATGEAEKSEAQLLWGYFFGNKLDFFKFLFLGVNIAFTLIVNFYVIVSLFDLIRSIQMTASMYLISFSLLISHLIFFADLNLGILLSKSHTENTKEFANKVKPRFMGDKDLFEE